MRMLIDVNFPLEPFNTLVRNGTVGQKIQQILADLKPEAAYFSERNGKRGGFLLSMSPNHPRCQLSPNPSFLPSTPLWSSASS